MVRWLSLNEKYDHFCGLDNFKKYNLTTLNNFLYCFCLNNSNGFVFVNSSFMFVSFNRLEFYHSFT